MMVVLCYSCCFKYNRFPRDEELKKKWIWAMKRDKYQPFRTAVICSEHFTAKDYVSGIKIKKLKNDAVPSVFSFPVAKKVKERRVLVRSKFMHICTCATKLKLF